MSVEERRQAIIDAVLPLLREHGADISTRQIADAAGVAEGTIFRAFGDKESLIAAAVDAYFDPLPFRASIRAIDRGLPTDEKIAQVLVLLRQRFDGAIRLMSALRMDPRSKVAGHHRHHDESGWLGELDSVFRPEELAVPVETLGYYLRLVAFGSTIPIFNERHQFGDEELLGLVLHGAIAHPRRT